MPTPRWKTAPPREPDPYLAAHTFKFLSSVDEWLLRRVEQVQFESDSAVRRQVSIDFRMPDTRPRKRHGDRHLIPLGFLRKQALTNFDLRDETGASIPVATRHENGVISWSMLIEVADLLLTDHGMTLRQAVVDDLWQVVVCYASEADEALAVLWSAPNNARQRNFLAADRDFARLARRLAKNFMLIVPMQHDPGARRVLKYSYIERFRWRPLSPTTRLAWRPIKIEFPVPALGESESYHFEVTAPAGLVISNAELRAGSETLTQSSKTGGVAHLYFPTEAERPKKEALAEVSVQAAIPGVVRSSALFIALLTGLLLLFAFRLREVKDDAAMAILLAVPGLIALFVARPREHDLTTRVLLTLRLFVVGTAFLPFAGSAMLAIDVSSGVLRDMWYLMSGIAFACFFVLLVAMARLRLAPPDTAPPSNA